MQNDRDIVALVESAAGDIREAVESDDHSTPEQRKAAIRRVLRQRTVGLDEKELSGFLERLRVQFPDRSYEADQEKRRMARDLAEAKLALRRALEENESLRLADSTRSVAVHTIASAIARGVGRELTGGPGQSEDPESVERVVFALARFAVRQEEVARATLKALPTDTQGQSADLGEVVLNALGGDERAIETFDRRIAWVGATPGALFAAAQQSWRSGTQRVLDFLSPARAEDSVGRSKLKAHIVVRTLKDRFEEFFNDFDGHIDSFYRAAFNNVLKSRMGDQSSDK